jgi:hypothetical protein
MVPQFTKSEIKYLKKEKSFTKTKSNPKIIVYFFTILLKIWCHSLVQIVSKIVMFIICTPSDFFGHHAPHLDIDISIPHPHGPLWPPNNFWFILATPK